MSVAFSSTRPRSKGEVTQQTIQKVTMSDASWGFLVKYSSLDGSVRVRRQCKESSLGLISQEMATGIVMLQSTVGAN